MLEALLAGVRTEANPPKITVYVHRQIPGDLAVHLLWRSEDEQEAPSLVGRLVADRLRRFGLVDHAAWDEVAP